MQIKIYLLQFAVALAAFVFGTCSSGIVEYFQFVFQTKEQKTDCFSESFAPAKIEPVRIEELIYPPRNVEPAKTPVLERTPVDAEPEEKTFCGFDAGGEYYIIGDLPKGFEDFDTLRIVTRDYETDPEDVDGIPISPKGYVLTSKEFKFTRINIAGKQISFKTQTRKGISYQFAGKFVDEPKASDEKRDYPELVGRLTKKRDGKKIAESKISFGIMCGC